MRILAKVDLVSEESVSTLVKLLTWEFPVLPSKHDWRNGDPATADEIEIDDRLFTVRRFVFSATGPTSVTFELNPITVPPAEHRQTVESFVERQWQI